jgi:aspartokinase/homoserine dehydrogenase 1
MKVLKFGGSSVAKPERIENIVKIVSEILETQTVAVVVSAFGGCTDDLLNMAQLALKQDQEAFELFDKVKARHFDAAEALLSAKAAVFDKAKDHLNKQFDQLHEVLRGVNMLQELSDRTLDLVASFGERLSAYIIAQAFSVNGVLADFLDARDLVVTNSNFLAAKVDFEKTDQNIADYFASKQNLQIITGFVARDSEGNTTTLGRGGSDYTASIFGAALNAEEVQIWTDVDGIMTADPRKVKSAFTLRSVTYQEAMEMSHFGAKVIYSPTMRPVMKKSIPLRIKNTLTPSAQGSVIGNENDVSGPIVKGVSSINDISLLRVQGSGLQGVLGFSSRLFGSLARAEVNIVLITQASSEYSICFAVVPKDAQRAKEVLEQEFIYEMREGQVDKVVVENDLAIVAVVGENMKNLPGVSGKIFKSLGENGVNVKAIAQGSSELNISIVIDKKQIEKSLNVIHDSLFLSDLKTLNVFLVGPGLVGKTLLQQLSENKNSLLNNQKIQLKLVALMNSQNMTFAQEGLDFTAWQQALENGEKANLDQFIEKM